MEIMIYSNPSLYTKSTAPIIIIHIELANLGIPRF